MTIRDLIRWNRSTAIPVQYSQRLQRSLEGVQDEMNRMFEHFYTGAEVHLTDWDKKLPTAPNINVTQDEKSIKIEAELAGIDPEQVNVEVADGYLTLKGEKKESQVDENKDYLRQEISYGSFYRMITLPDTVDGKKAEASFKNGILTITVPKKAEAMEKPTKLQIKKAA